MQWPVLHWIIGRHRIMWRKAKRKHRTSRSVRMATVAAGGGVSGCARNGRAFRGNVRSGSGVARQQQEREVRVQEVDEAAEQNNE